MADQLPEGYWESLGPNGAVLRAFLATQQQQLQQLQIQNQFLQTQFSNVQNDLANAASAAAVAVAQNISIPTPPNPPTSRSIKAADPEKFSGDRSDTEGFIRAVRLSIAVQPGSFPDERTKILYALSFMTGGSAQTWAHNETETVINGTSPISTFDAFARRVEEAFGDPDFARTARTKLHDLKMTPNMSADDYTAQFEILASRTGFNDAALEDAYARGLPPAILDKIHAQPSLPQDLKAWKEAARQIDRNHRRLLEVRRAQTPHPSTRSTQTRTHTAPNPPSLSAAVAPTPSEGVTPMDIDSSRRRTETRTCYNCNKRGHISTHCPEPRKERVRANYSEANLAEMISKSVTAALDAQKASLAMENKPQPKEGDQDF
jgi:Retrotransposon gag protein/Zinc knuckle